MLLMICYSKGFSFIQRKRKLLKRERNLVLAQDRDRDRNLIKDPDLARKQGRKEKKNLESKQAEATKRNQQNQQAMLVAVPEWIRRSLVMSLQQSKGLERRVVVDMLGERVMMGVLKLGNQVIK